MDFAIYQQDIIYQHKFNTRFNSLRTRPTPSKHKYQNELIVFLLKVTLAKLWHARNTHVFERKQVTYIDITSAITQHIKFRINSAYKHTQAQDFQKKWAINNALCSIAQSRLVIHI